MIKKQENMIAFQSTDIDGGVGAITSPGRARTKTAAPLLSNFRKIKKGGYPHKYRSSLVNTTFARLLKCEKV